MDHTVSFWVFNLILFIFGNLLTNFVITKRGHEYELPFLIRYILWPVALIASLSIPAKPEENPFDPTVVYASPLKTTVKDDEAWIRKLDNLARKTESKKL
jgi:hypothetical protein